MKRKVILLAVFLAFLTGVLFALIDGSREKGHFSGDIVVDGVPAPSPAEDKHPAAEPLTGDRTVETKASGIRPVSGEPFSRADLKSVEKPLTEIVPKRSGDEVLDITAIHPIVKKTADQVIEMVEDFDRKTLETTQKVLEKVPILDIRPDKAELRPSGDGLKLTLTMDPEDIKFKRQEQEVSDDVIVSGDNDALEK